MIVARIISWWQSLQSACTVAPRALQSLAALKWSEPPPGFLKINVDGAWRESQKLGGFGVVIWDKEAGRPREFGSLGNPSNWGLGFSNI